MRISILWLVFGFSAAAAAAPGPPPAAFGPACASVLAPRCQPASDPACLPRFLALGSTPEGFGTAQGGLEEALYLAAASGRALIEPCLGVDPSGNPSPAGPQRQQVGGRGEVELQIGAGGSGGGGGGGAGAGGAAAPLPRLPLSLFFDVAALAERTGACVVPLRSAAQQGTEAGAEDTGQWWWAQAAPASAGHSASAPQAQALGGALAAAAAGSLPRFVVSSKLPWRNGPGCASPPPDWVIRPPPPPPGPPGPSGPAQEEAARREEPPAESSAAAAAAAGLPWACVRLGRPRYTQSKSEERRRRREERGVEGNDSDGPEDTEGGGGAVNKAQRQKDPPGRPNGRELQGVAKSLGLLSNVSVVVLHDFLADNLLPIGPWEFSGAVRESLSLAVAELTSQWAPASTPPPSAPHGASLAPRLPPPPPPPPPYLAAQIRALKVWRRDPAGAAACALAAAAALAAHARERGARWVYVATDTTRDGGAWENALGSLRKSLSADGGRGLARKADLRAAVDRASASAAPAGDGGRGGGQAGARGNASAAGGVLLAGQEARTILTEVLARRTPGCSPPARGGLPRAERRGCLEELSQEYAMCVSADTFVYALRAASRGPAAAAAARPPCACVCGDTTFARRIAEARALAGRGSVNMARAGGLRAGVCEEEALQRHYSAAAHLWAADMTAVARWSKGSPCSSNE